VSLVSRRVASRRRALVVWLALGGACKHKAAEPRLAVGEISVRTLVADMGRLDHLARLAPAPFSSRQATSYDRRSRSPNDGDAWFANDDFVTDVASNLVRIDATPAGKRYVLLDADGPGAVVRLWTATPTGTLRLYVDGDPNPALEAPMSRLLSGEVEPFSPPFGQVTAMGFSLYFPFPYRRHVTVTVDSIRSTDPFTGKTVDRFYYQVGYRTYAADQAVNVRSYGEAELGLARSALARAVARMNGASADLAPAGRRVLPIARTSVAPGVASVTTWDAPPGGGCVSTLRLTSSERDPEKLGATQIAISFDGEDTVRLPLVALFGTGPGWNAYASLPLTVGADGTLTCRFPMPFAKSGRLAITRAAPGAVDVAGAITIDPRPFGADALVFHARRRAPETFATRPFRDWHLATLSGRGQLVGAVLGAENPPGVAWWGEGDEKIRVDGEAFPSWFGTGTEDYFGYAWSSLARFSHPYHAQTLAPAGSFAGRFSMNRFHVLDPIPFDSSLTFDFEAWHWSDTRMTLEATLYWYARPGGGDDFP
jgi:hypothetical protein